MTAPGPSCVKFKIEHLMKSVDVSIYNLKYCSLQKIIGQNILQQATGIVNTQALGGSPESTMRVQYW